MRPEHLHLPHRPFGRATVAVDTALGLAAGSVTGMTARYLMLNWGATTGETREPLPGDAVLTEADLVATRSITIQAPPEEVWPWIAQLGQGRGGFYSYDWLENLLGCDVRSAENIVEQWQRPSIGDEVRLHPKVALKVVEVRPGHALVLHAAAPPVAPYDFTWAFVVRPHPHRATRLIVRERYSYRAAWSALVCEPLAVGSYVMTQRMLRGLRDRAEDRT